LKSFTALTESTAELLIRIATGKSIWTRAWVVDIHSPDPIDIALVFSSVLRQ